MSHNLIIIRRKDTIITRNTEHIQRINGASVFLTAESNTCTNSDDQI